MITPPLETHSKHFPLATWRSAWSAVLIVGLASGQTISSAADHTLRDSGAAVVARSGGFPKLEPRLLETPGRSHDESRIQPTYRVASSSDASRAGAGGGGDGAAASQAETAQLGGNDDLALRTDPESSRSKMLAPLVTVASSLAIVLALFSALVWAGRKFGGRASGSKPLPASALTPLGHVMLDPRTKLLLVKCGRRVLVLSQTAAGITPITEVNHPDEVQELIASCSADAREAFQRTLREVELEPTRGFTDSPPAQGAARQSKRLFATA